MSAAAEPYAEAHAGPNDDEGLLALLDELLEVRGVVAAAVVTADAEMVANRSNDELRLERTVASITSALAAGQALGELIPGEDDAADTAADDGATDTDNAGAISSVMLMFDEGPILLKPIADAQRVVVLALEGERDLGRARLALRALMARLSAAAAQVS